MGLSSNNKMKIEGGMASMTDLVFLLLIFFIIMSLMSNDQFTVDLPETSTEPPSEIDHVTPTLEVTKDNLYVVKDVGDDSPGELEDLKELVESVVLKSNSTKLKIAGDKEASYEAVFAALALCSANGWDPVLAYNK
ncbi:MAG: biopolymer transporter ExbD [Crocinitomicaceae bacterium]|nr:biopolymer transporter ExbD [Crocinitomicaceae bacterium]